MFNNLKIIELASVLAGPSVGQFFAELGSEVIKVENPNTNGDVTRSWKLSSEDNTSDISAYFTAVNWGKKSIVLDITKPVALNQLYDLIKNADIVIASYKPGDAQILKVDYDTLKNINPRIIYGHITGYGLNSSRLGYDAIIQAESGFMYLNGEAGGEAVKMPVALIDILASHQLKEAILIALINRMKTNIGAYLHVSLINAAIASLANQASNYLVGKVIPQRVGSEHPNIVPYGSQFTTKDGFKIVLAVGNDKQFEALCKILNLELGDKFNTNSKRVQNRNELIDILKIAILNFSKTKLLEDLEQNQVPAGAINDMKTVFENMVDEQLLFKSKNYIGIKTFIAEGLNNDFKPSPPPHLGEY